MILETQRLILRPWDLSDANSLFEYASDPDVGPIAGWPAHKSVEESRNVITNVFNSPLCYAVCLKEDNIAIGAIELKRKEYTDMTDQEDECELGYWLGKPFWGNGYIPEAANAMICYAFEELHMTAIWCGYYEGNIKSKRVQEKCGFIYKYTSPDLPVPLLHETRTGYSNILTKERWLMLHENTVTAL